MNAILTETFRFIPHHKTVSIMEPGCAELETVFESHRIGQHTLQRGDLVTLAKRNQGAALVWLEEAAPPLLLLVSFADLEPAGL